MKNLSSPFSFKNFQLLIIIGTLAFMTVAYMRYKSAISEISNTPLPVINPQANQQIKPESLVKDYMGTIKTGKELKIDYCLDALYFETDNVRYLLTMNDNAGNTRMLKTKEIANHEVSISGEIKLSKGCNESKKSCDCDNYIIAKAISVKPQ